MRDPLRWADINVLWFLIRQQSQALDFSGCWCIVSGVLDHVSIVGMLHSACLCKLTRRRGVSILSIYPNPELWRKPVRIQCLKHEPLSCGAGTHSNPPLQAHTLLVQKRPPPMCLQRNKQAAPARKESSGWVLVEESVFELLDRKRERWIQHTAIETVTRCHGLRE